MSTPIELVSIVNNVSLNVKLFVGDTYYKQGYTKVDDAHIHDCCEIYINRSGNVSFLVENTLYPISHGDVILTMPNEMHHCVYNSDGVHGHICLWIKATGDTEDILSLFTNRKKGEGNLISLNEEDRKKAFELADSINEHFASGNIKSIGMQADLYGLLAIISGYQPQKNVKKALPDSFEKILFYIDANLSSAIDGKSIANEFYISRSTLYRLFRDYLNISPAKYIEAKRLSVAKEMLKSENSIQEVYSACGFNDYSHFIATFKKKFGVSPYRYKKML